MKKHFRIPTSDGEIHALVCSIEEIQQKDTPIVIFSHGFTVSGFESRRMFLNIADRLVKKGLICLLFDYRGSGYSDKAFEDMTIQTEIEDLNHVIDFAKLMYPKHSKIAIWSMSMGTAVTAEVAVKRQSEFSALIFWGLSAELYRRWNERYGHKLKDKDSFYLDKGFLFQRKLLESVKDIDTFSSLRKILIPRLFVIGENDQATPADLTRRAEKEAIGSYKSVYIQDGSHGFKFQPDRFEEAVSASIDWLFNEFKLKD